MKTVTSFTLTGAALAQTLDSTAKNLYGMTKSEALASGVCVKCHEEAAPKIHTDAGTREYQQSGLCEDCFDSIFAEDD